MPTNQKRTPEETKLTTTLLSALRIFQRLRNSAEASEIIYELTQAQPKLSLLNNDEIDEICESINFRDGIADFLKNPFTETYNSLAISTDHLSKDDMLALKHEAARGHMMFTRDTGVIIKLYDEPEYNRYPNFSENLITIIETARDHNFRLIEFDCAALPSHLFPLVSDGNF